MPVYVSECVYPVIHFHDDTDWEALLDICGGFLTSGALDKFRNRLQGHAQSVVVERDYIDKDYRDTHSGFYSRKFAEYPTRCLRLHFFSEEIAPDRLWSIGENQASYIGYSVIRPTRINCIGRTLLDPAKLGIQGPYHLCLQASELTLLGHKLEVKGFPYISQDTDVTVCAHAACWMVFRYFSEKYSFYREIYPFQIAQLTSDYSHGRRIPSPGLTVLQVAEVFNAEGFFPLIYVESQWDTGRFRRLLYYYIESGFPVVACLSSRKHAVTILGHVSDFDAVPSLPGPVDSADLVTGFVLNDDNHLPYQVISADPQSHPDGFTLDEVDSFVVPLPEKVHLLAHHVEDRARQILGHPEFGIEKLSPGVSMQNLVFRIFLTSARGYKRNRRELVPNSDLRRFYTWLPMPRLIWVAEISRADLYPEQVIGEIVWDSTANHFDDFSFLFIHYPERLIVNDRNSLKDGHERFSFDTAIPDAGPYPLYRHNLEEVP